MSKKEDLPSINDYLEDSELPSYKDFIEEEKELPSVEEYKTHVEEETIEDANGNTFAEVIDVIKAPEWQELVKLVNDVRKDIPEIPEIKSYDVEIGEISEKIAEIQENFSQYDLKSDKIYDLKAKNEQFEVKLSEIEQKIPEVPEIRYYEGDIELIYNKISRIKEEIESLPEVKYYENDLDVLKSRIEEVNDNIPTFPKWVNEVNEVPDFSWIGKTFGVIDDDFKKVQSHLDFIKETISSRVSELNEVIETKDFEQRVDSKTLSENLDTTNNRLTETKDKIYKELREMTLRVYDHHKEFKDDDRKLKKAILSEQNKLKQTLKEQIKSIEKESIKTDEKIISFYTDFREEVEQKFNSLPEVKYYDDDIKTLKQDVRFIKVSVKNCLEDVKKISSEIKKTQIDLSEGLLDEPHNKKETAGGQTDPLTPLNQKFATLDDLSKHYRLFISRIQTQLSTMGGGGAGFIKDLDDVEFDGTTGEGKLLIYDQSRSKWVGIASTALSGGSGGDADSASKLVLDVRNNNIGYALTIGTPVYQIAYNSGLDRLDVEESRASSSVTMPAKGVVSTDLANNDSGQIIVYGELEGVNTQAFDVGDELYVAPGGGLTNVRPTDPTHLVQKIAVVLKKSTANGAILVYGAGRTNDVPNNISIAGSITAVDGFFSGNVTVGGTVTYEDVKNVDSLGIVTARTGVDVLAGGINVVGVSTISTGIGTVQIGVGDTALLVQGDARVTGILTVGTSSLTLDGINNVVNVGTALTLGHTQGIQFYSQNLHASGFDVNNINASGIITATSFRGDGSQLTNIISGVGIQSGSVRIGTGFTDINFTGAGITVVGSGTTVTVDIPSSTITRQTETSSGVTTDFTITGGYTVGLIDVFLNGVKQRSGVDFTASDGSTVTMTPFISDGDVVEFQKYDKLNIAGITSVTNATNAYNIVGGVSFATSAGIATALNSDSSVNTSGIITAASFVGDGTGLTGVASTDNIITGTAATFTGNVNISGVTTVGLLTAYTTIKVGTAITMDSASGIVTATSFSGDGSNLTGVISGVEVKNNGTSVGTGITAINFSTNVTATASGGIATVTASGGGGGGSEGPSSVMMGMIF